MGRIRERRRPGRRLRAAVLARTLLAGLALFVIMRTGVEGQRAEVSGTLETLVPRVSRPADSNLVITSWTNATSIVIPGEDIAIPYPSTITVTELPVPGEVLNVRAYLNGFSHGFPDDVDVLLEGPNLRRIVLMSDVGGGFSASNLTLGFDDNAAGPLPDNAQLISGLFFPTNIGDSDLFPPPAPFAVPGWTLRSFNGRNPLGAWKLYIVDDLAGFAGSVSGGWTLSLTTTTNSRFDVAIDFGAQGLWTYYNFGQSPGWVQRHSLSPTAMTSGDLDGNEQIDLVVNFQGYGLFAYMNNATWVHLHPYDATDVKAGDVNGNGKADLVINFPGIGVWVRYDNGTWVQLHQLNATAMAVASINGDFGNRAEVILHFPGYGLWQFQDNILFNQIHSATVLDVQTGDLNGNDIPDLIVSFQGQGLWARYDSGTWAQLHPSNPTRMTLGNLDGDVNFRSDLVVNFQGFGVWAWMNNAAWVQLHNLQAPVMATGDVDGNGKADLMLHFPGYGIWVLRNYTTWSQIHPSAPEMIATGRFDGT
jgi:hypothetical protein